ncbi:hypothetical protein [Dyella flagellata]|nr:hypothetical protein [Dyella flagellata]
MSHNPYAAPAATLERSESASIALYSPMQAAMGAFLGGPVGLIYFLRHNFTALGNKFAARMCLIAGALLIVALVIVLPLLPGKFPSTPLTVAYVVIARYIATNYQASKQTIAESTRYIFKSNWNVLGAGLLCLLVSVIVLVGLYWVFHPSAMHA